MCVCVCVCAQSSVGCLSLARAPLFLEEVSVGTERASDRTETDLARADGARQLVRGNLRVRYKSGPQREKSVEKGQEMLKKR